MSKRNRPRPHMSRKSAAQARRARRANRPSGRGSRKPPPRCERCALSESRNSRIGKVFGLLSWTGRGFADAAGNRLWRWVVDLAVFVVRLVMRIF
ncbi:hypothetical protein [Actinacidiphila paucisporea]|uniref:Uncharacterized protein n=1 Tax=Actinacidiphila paucisporea TaxID=310782 RepID=A0A1M7C7H5_9ACTN|nr:hypothetical protein [Actinacidiphila paucisporea]SHL63150.1 hypothetical protein SAMN05216499_105161 [Actinacidiphila paucisporea]